MAPPGTFRTSNYRTYVWFGKRTIKEGECCSIWDQSGRREVIIGPELRYIWRSLVQFMDRKFAHQQQYLVVKHKTGVKDHVKGPISMFVDPILHNSIEVKDATHVNSFEVIVVYKELAEDKVERRIIRGPVVFIPDASEWIHEFSWHGTDPENKTKIKANVNVFQKLETIPQQLYYNVTDVRTSDDAQVTVKLMIFYEIFNIELLLDTTQDPVADIINSLCSDVIQICSTKTYDQFIQGTSEFNELLSYKVLTTRAEAVGVKVSKVVYRGYQASEQLQKMHDSAIQSRTKLHQESDIAKQAQELEDMQLARKLERSMKEMQLQDAAKQHELKLKMLEYEQELKKKEMSHKELMRQKEEENRIELEKIRFRNQEQVDFLQKMKTLEVDLTKYLVAGEQKVDRLIRVEGTAQPNILFTEQHI